MTYSSIVDGSFAGKFFAPITGDDSALSSVGYALGNKVTCITGRVGQFKALVLKSELNSSGSGERITLWVGGGATSLTALIPAGFNQAVVMGASIAITEVSDFSLLYDGASAGTAGIINVALYFEPT